MFVAVIVMVVCCFVVGVVSVGRARYGIITLLCHHCPLMASFPCYAIIAPYGIIAPLYHHYPHGITTPL